MLPSVRLPIARKFGGMGMSVAQKNVAAFSAQDGETMTPYEQAMQRADEAFEALAKLFAGPMPPPGKERWQHRQYILVRLDDGSIGFVREPFDLEFEAIFNGVMGRRFGAKPDEKDESFPVDVP
jgi:hypothetical protein